VDSRARSPCRGTEASVRDQWVGGPGRAARPALDRFRRCRIRAPTAARDSVVLGARPYRREGLSPV